MTRSRIKTVLLTLLPIAVVSFSLALRLPDKTDVIYSQSIYPLVARAFAFVNQVPFSLAEPIALFLIVFVLWSLYHRLRRRERRWSGVFLWIWRGAGVFVAMFLVLWGFNYARPSLADRSALSADTVDAHAVLSAGERAAEITSSLFDALDNEQTPTLLPFTFAELNQNLDRAFEHLRLPGDSIDFDPDAGKTPRKLDIVLVSGHQRDLHPLHRGAFDQRAPARRCASDRRRPRESTSTRRDPRR